MRNMKGPASTWLHSIVLVILISLPLVHLAVSSPVVVVSAHPDDDPGTVDWPWWATWSRDPDRDRIDEELEYVLETTGPDEEISLFVDYDRRPVAGDLEALRSLGAEIDYVCRYIDTVIVRIDTKRVRSLVTLPSVVMLEADPEVEMALDSAQRSVDMDNVKTNWSYRGDDVVIGVVDSGVDADHIGLDDMDDINETIDPKVIAFYDAKNTPNERDGTTLPYDDDGHGSHVSGIAAGTGDGSEDYMYQGLAPGAKIVGIKVLGQSDNSMSDAMQGLEWARDNKEKYGIDILSLSFGARLSTGVNNDGNSAISRQCNELVEDGFVVVVSAGNSGPRKRTIAPPGDARQVLTVGNVQDDHNLHTSSSRGPVGDFNDYYIKPDVCAPGTDIYSVDFNTMDNYTEKTGTSMSAPFVSGLVALMLQIEPEMTPTKVKTMLQNTAGQEEMYPFQGSPNTDYGYGIVDPFKIISNLTGGVRPPSLVVDDIAPLVRGETSLEGTASSEYGPIQRVEVQTGGAVWNRVEGGGEWSYEWDTSAMENGPVELRFRAYDGNLHSVIERRSTSVNNVDVRVSLPSNAEFRGNSTIRGSATGLHIERIEVRVDTNEWIPVNDISPDGDWSSWEYSFSSKGYTTGKHTLIARSFDGYGHCESQAHVFRILGDEDTSGMPIPGIGTVMMISALCAAVFLSRWRGG